MTVERKILDVDSQTGITETYNYDHADGRIILANEQDATEILKAAKRHYDAIPHKHKRERWRKPFVTVARLPLLTCLKLQRLGIMDKGFGIRDEVAFQIWLDEHNKFSTAPGRFA